MLLNPPAADSNRCEDFDRIPKGRISAYMFSPRSGGKSVIYMHTLISEQVFPIQ